MTNLIQDLRYGVRMLAKNPGFTAVALITLALGIGANTVIFSVVNAVLLRPLPYKSADRLVTLWESVPRLGAHSIGVAVPDFIDFQQRNHVFENMAAFRNRPFNLTGEQPERIAGTKVSSSLFDVLGVSPVLGRAFSVEEDRAGHDQVVILSYGLWQRRFGSDPGILGKAVILDGRNYSVVGVMPRDFRFPPPGFPSSEVADLWVPIAFTANQLNARGEDWNIRVIARLKPGVRLERANAEVKTIAQGILQSYPAEVRQKIDLDANVTLLSRQIVANVQTLLAVLLGAVGFVLLIACANIANLLLARSAERGKEMAVRSALGAGRGRLIRQLLCESLLLAVFGGLAALLLAYWANQVLVSLAPSSIPRVQETRLDTRVLSFTLLVSLVSSLLFGLVPTLQASKVDLYQTLKKGGRIFAASGHRNRLQGLLVVSEIALALILLTGAGLLIRSFLRLRDVQAGFQPERVLTMRMTLPESKYVSAQQVKAFYESLVKRIETIPGVEMVGAGTSLPLVGGMEIIFTIEGRTALASFHGRPPVASNSIVTPDYFRALGIPLRAGRLFTAQDNQDSPPVILINQTMARSFWPGEDPLGKRLKWGPSNSSRPWLTVAGVVGDFKQSGLDAETLPAIYMSFLQLDPDHATRQGRTMSFAVRTAVNPLLLADTLRKAVHDLDKDQPISDISTMPELLNKLINSRRFGMFLVALFATVALALAGVGIYGVVSYSVSHRAHEIGIRMALGAQRRDVLRLVLRHGVALTLAGMAVGLLGAFLLTRLISSLLYGIRPTDPVTFLIVPAGLSCLVLLASYIPARRATKVDPMVALRYE